MKVILIKDVRGVGVKSEVKIVSDGYAMNYLFPHKLAEVATYQKISEIEASRAAHEGELRMQEELLAGTIRSAENARVEMPVRATEKGGLFKSVGSSEIVRALKEQKGIDIPESAVTLENPIKTVGEHAILLQHKAAKANITVAVVAKQ